MGGENLHTVLTGFGQLHVPIFNKNDVDVVFLLGLSLTNIEDTN